MRRKGRNECEENQKRTRNRTRKIMKSWKREDVKENNQSKIGKMK